MFIQTRSTDVTNLERNVGGSVNFKKVKAFLDSVSEDIIGASPVATAVTPETGALRACNMKNAEMLMFATNNDELSNDKRKSIATVNTQNNLPVVIGRTKEMADMLLSGT